VHAAATGTVVGWDGLKLLTLEHVATNGRLFRTMYNMVRDVPVPPAVDGVVDMGTEVAAGQVVGQAWDPPGNVLHLHFAMAIPHQAEVALQPDLAPLFGQLARQFGVTFTEPERGTVRALLDDSPWPPTEWFTVDPFGRYDISRSDSATYGPVGRGFYYPVPPGPATNAFTMRPIGGDPGVDPTPLFAWHDALLDQVPVQPMSLGTMAAVLD
jgi:hypothetical protein